VSFTNVLFDTAGPGVSITATGGGLMGTSPAFAVGNAPTKLTFGIFTPAPPVANRIFSVRVMSADGSNQNANVVADTVVTLAITAGAGALSGTLTQTLFAGSNTVVFNGLTYSAADTPTFQATASGLTTASESTQAFSPTPAPGAATRIDVSQGNAQTAPAGTNV